jgi:hypothetical protein
VRKCDEELSIKARRFGEKASQPTAARIESVGRLSFETYRMP